MSVADNRIGTSSLLGYAWYLLPLVPCSFSFYLLGTLGTASGFLVIDTVIGTLIVAGLLGGICEQQDTGSPAGLRTCARGVRAHYPRLLAAKLIYSAVYAVLVLVVVLPAGATDPQSLADHYSNLIDIPFTAVTLFWTTAVVVERKLFPALPHALKALLTQPAALAIGLGWGTILLLDRVLWNLLAQPISLTLYAARAAIYAVLQILAVVFAVSSYKRAYGAALRP